MQATSAAPLPLPAAAPPANAGPQPGNAAASGAEGQQQETPFAAALGRQMKASGGEEKPDAAPKQPADRRSADIAVEPGADALAILASMLNGITAPPPESPVAGLEQTGTAVDDQMVTDAAAIAVEQAEAPLIAAPAVAMAATPAQTNADSTSGSRDTGRTENAPLQLDATSSAKPDAAIVAAAPATKAEASADNGKGNDGEFAAMLDAARAGNDKVGASVSALASAPQAQAVPAHVVHAPATPHASGPAPEQHVATPVGAPGWGQEVGERVSWMVGRQESRAELILNPPQLGRIEVSVSVTGDQATATFVSANPAVREALENAMPHLREVLQSAGISLGQTQVGAESFQQSANAGENGDNSARGRGDGNESSPQETASDTTSTRWLQRGNGLVDTFA